MEKSGSSMGGRGSDRLIIIPLSTANQLPRNRDLTYTAATPAPRCRSEP